MALTLSDPFCIERNLNAFKKIIKGGIDLLFCNEAELKLLYRTKTLDEAVREGSKEVELLACTIAEKGAIISEKERIMTIPTEKVRARDTTGAGDLFAAGFLNGIVKQKNIETCGHMGNLAALEIISYLGARPTSDLKILFDNKFFK